MFPAHAGMLLRSDPTETLEKSCFPRPVNDWCRREAFPELPSSGFIDGFQNIGASR